MKTRMCLDNPCDGLPAGHLVRDVLLAAPVERHRREANRKEWRAVAKWTVVVASLLAWFFVGCLLGAWANDLLDVIFGPKTDAGSVPVPAVQGREPRLLDGDSSRPAADVRRSNVLSPRNADRAVAWATSTAAGLSFFPQGLVAPVVSPRGKGVPNCRPLVTNRKFRNSRISKFLNWRVTAYCPCQLCCGARAVGITASGTRADHPLAAGPASIPFGTLLSIPGYGRVHCEDRGGAIRGRRLDLLFPTHAEALAWGVRQLRIERMEKRL
jgi:3D (Asp-Asp-Asp) domain-containing protein